MRSFYLHIGMHKTASSACQRLFDARRAELATAGLRYFEWLDFNHSYLVSSLFGERHREVVKLVDANYLVGDYRDRPAMLRRWAEFVADTGGDALVSAESASDLSAAQVRRLCSKELRAYRVEALALVRPPASFARSSAQQRLRGGFPLERMVEKPPLPHYRGRFEKYVELLGRDRVQLEIFHPARMIDGDPAKTLLAMMGRGAMAGMTTERFNESVSATAAKLLSILGAAIDDSARLGSLPAPVLAALRALPAKRYGFAGVESGEAPGARIPRRLMRLVQRIPGPPFGLPGEIRDAAVEASREDVAWINELLGTDITRFDDAPNGDAPRLRAMEEFDQAEIETIAGHLAAAPRHGPKFAEILAARGRAQPSSSIDRSNAGMS